MPIDNNAKPPEFRFLPYPQPWLGGEPRVFPVYLEDDFPRSYDLQGTQLVEVDYAGGGLKSLFESIAVHAQVRSNGIFQALLENLEEISRIKPLIVFIRHADRLLADIGPALVHMLLRWERYVRAADGVRPMYLVVEMGPWAAVKAAFGETRPVAAETSTGGLVGIISISMKRDNLPIETDE